MKNLDKSLEKNLNALQDNLQEKQDNNELSKAEKILLIAINLFISKIKKDEKRKKDLKSKRIY